MKNDNFLIAGIAVDKTVYHFDRIFSYKVPQNMNSSPGQRVLVPFGKGNRLRQGMVLVVREDYEENLKEISSLLDKDSRKKAFKLFNNNYVHLIGSNACDPISNPVLMKEAEQVFTKKYSKRVYIDLMNNAKLVLKNISVEEILL